MRVLPKLIVRGTVLVLVGLLLSGCTGAMPIPQHLGFRPDEPLPQSQATTCLRYTEYATYAQQLQESYHSRASQNRAWIYVAAVLGLGAIAASGGLAAAGAATLGTIALINISGGFSAGVFATIDNSTLAEIYTISAKAIDAARTESENKVKSAPGVESDCQEALEFLRSKVSDARQDLEEARTNSAKAAVMRAAAQQKALKEHIESLGLGFDVTEPIKKELGPNDATAVTITGGKPPYTATAVGTGLDVTEPSKAKNYIAVITPRANATPGDYEVIFRDSGGSWKSRTFTVKAATKQGTPAGTKDLTVLPVPSDSATIRSRKGQRVVFYVSGGSGKYTVGPLDPAGQGGIALEPASGSKVTDGHVVVTLTDRAQADRAYSVTVIDDGDNKTKTFSVAVAPSLAFVGVPADGRVTLTEGTTLAVSIVGGLQRSGYAVASPDASKLIDRTATSGRFVLDSNGVKPGAYEVIATDDLAQEARLSVTVVSKPVVAVPPVDPRDRVRRVQEALKANQCDPKGPDGIMGPNTKAALECFQKAARLTVTGSIDQPTLDALKVN